MPPSTPTGNNRRIELAGLDLLLSMNISNVFVYPGEIKIEHLKQALSQTLSLWPLVAGRTRLVDDEHYFIEMCDNSIPIKFVINNELKEWPLDSNVIVEIDNKEFPTFIDEVDGKKCFKNSFNNDDDDEPLVRLKLTHITQSDEWVLGISWYHPLGDAASCFHFSNTLSRFYQQMEPIKPLPIFERHLWKEEDTHQLVLPLPKQYLYSQSMEEVMKTYLSLQPSYDPVHLYFSGDQLTKLRTLAGGDNITVQDALTAYIILTLNTCCYKHDDERRILYTATVINCHGVSDSICCYSECSNCLFMMRSDNFNDPYSLSSISETIRQSIIKARDPKLLAPALATLDGIFRKNIKNNLTASAALIPNEFGVNSNFRFDWANLVDFGYTDQCRFHTPWSGILYARVFRLNPIKNGNNWLPRDRNGAYVSFRMEKDLKEVFLNALKQDILENFENVRL